MDDRDAERERIRAALATAGMVGKGMEPRRAALIERLIEEGDAGIVTKAAMRAMRAEGRLRGTTNVVGWILNVLESTEDRREYIPELVNEHRDMPPPVRSTAGKVEPGDADRDADRKRKDHHRDDPKEWEACLDREACARFCGDRKSFADVATLMGESVGEVRERIDRQLQCEGRGTLDDYLHVLHERKERIRKRIERAKSKSIKDAKEADDGEVKAPEPIDPNYGDECDG